MQRSSLSAAYLRAQVCQVLPIRRNNRLETHVFPAQLNCTLINSLWA